MKKILLISVILGLSFNSFAEKWYNGGNLHSATAIEWSKAEYTNKLATAGDFISKMWLDKNFSDKVKIKNMDDAKVYADGLVKCVDTTITGKNGKLEATTKNTSITEISVMCMVLAGWLK